MDAFTKNLERLAKLMNEHGKRLRRLEIRGQPNATFTNDITAPSVPTGLVAQGFSYHQVQLTWTASTDNVGVAGYTIYRDDVQIGSVSGGTLYNDYTVDAATYYTYAVDAFDLAGNHSEKSATYSVTTPGGSDITPPSTPNTIVQSGLTPTSVTLSWNASVDNVGVAGYTVYRNGVPVALPTGTSYTDSALSPLSSYVYTIDAFDAAGNHSGQSTAVTVNTPALPVTNTYYVSPTGSSSNTGKTYDSPWSLTHAMNGAGGGAITAGSTVYLLNGDYTISSSQIVTGFVGTSTNHITFRPYPSEHARFRNNYSTAFNTLELRNVAYVDFIGLEFTMYGYDRSTEVGGGVAMAHIWENPTYTQSYSRFLNCNFHDSAGKAINLSPAAIGTNFDGCMFYYNGSSSTVDWTALVVGDDTKTKTIRNCIFLHNAADDIRAYSSTATNVQDIIIDDNYSVLCGSPYGFARKSIMVGGTTAKPDSITVTGNITYNRMAAITGSRSVQLGSLGTGTSSAFTANEPTSDGYWGSDGTTFSSNSGSIPNGKTSTYYTSSWFSFASVTIPQGATITSAYMTHYKQNAETQSVYTRVRGNYEASAVAPTSAADATSKTRTTASVNWTISNWSIGTVNTPDFSTVVQEIVNRPDWASGNTMMFFLDENGATSTNDVWIASVDHATDPATTLYIGYTTGTSDAGLNAVNAQYNVLIGQPVDVDGTGYSNVTFANNTAVYNGSHIGATTTKYPANTWISSYPTSGTSVYCKAYAWNTRMANIMIINWSGYSNIGVAASSLVGLTIATGDNYMIRNLEDYYADVMYGTFSGTEIVFPMYGHSRANPAGGLMLPTSIYPTVGLFQIEVFGYTPPPVGDITPPTIPTGLAVVPG